MSTSNSLCDSCQLTPWKYRCPSCSLKSCSLPCVQSHKTLTGCTGKRNRTQFVPLSQFDDALLISDYNLLEETKRVAESAKRMAGSGFRGYIGFRLPRGLMMLRNAANRKGTKLLLLPPGMEKREANRSRYDQRKKSIFWTIEWRFNATDVVLIDHSVDEHANLHSVIEKHLAPGPLRNKLSVYRNVQIDDLKFFLRKTPKGLNSPFRELDVNAPIGKQLLDVVILEYPVIFVFLPSHRYDFEVEKVARPPSLVKVEPPASFDGKLSPKGNFFVEEEIEEGEVSADTLITDLAGIMDPYAGDASDMQMLMPVGNGHQPSVLQEVNINCGVGLNPMKIHRTVAEGSKPVVCQKPQDDEFDCSMYFSDPVMPSQDDKFDFQQELRDVYSDLVEDINPDDFLCLDNNFNGIFDDEDLEEGEIPSF